MEKFKDLEAAIIDLIKSQIASYRSSSLVKMESVIDKEQNKYLLLLRGWDDNRYVYSLLFHFDIIDGKIWLQHNGTDLLITDELIKRGVPKKEIVLGFQPEYAREYAGFAVA